jgi:hypothetical protein
VIIKNTDDAFFVVDRGGWLSQNFMSSKPNHMLMRLMVDQGIERLLNQTDIYRSYIPSVRGPGALKVAFVHLMNESYALYQNNINSNSNARSHIKSQYEKPPKGFYPSPIYPKDSVTVAGDWGKESNDIIIRDSIRFKHKDYSAMNMTHHFDVMEAIKENDPMSCRELIRQKTAHHAHHSNANSTLQHISENNDNNTEAVIHQEIEHQRYHP